MWDKVWVGFFGPFFLQYYSYTTPLAGYDAIWQEGQEAHRLPTAKYKKRWLGVSAVGRTIHCNRTEVGNSFCCKSEVLHESISTNTEMN